MTPRWTDPNEHDPGITLLALLSWLALGLLLLRRIAVARGRAQTRREFR